MLQIISWIRNENVDIGFCGQLEIYRYI